MDFMERIQTENAELKKDKQQQMSKVNQLLSSASDTLCNQVNQFLADKEQELEQRVKQEVLLQHQQLGAPTSNTNNLGASSLVNRRKMSMAILSSKIERWCIRIATTTTNIKLIIVEYFTHDVTVFPKTFIIFIRIMTKTKRTKSAKMYYY